ncbi:MULTISPECIES: flagellar hook-basal body complex protein FliE [Acidobacterium]|uniref:Flagellar hook-basal body complex protein FliE n=1 Tax=Acidobacterium capsulatum (strain ATCC 51196 / DSM 11244 / BCRC 80197 / JCM 7670 / NBRC 15755 / NCIMB 13165 / 161) TaxID=240015 RepID=C1F983_ACIC5|nr:MULTISPECIES: flagellar hook-basal body complex protein FliE [Acidobacterium]ACO32117.1 flagellar hook-basal body complex protein FliE [Acidobacterium capsulatum ATCC 51196]HCT61606.1 flagellar hook-basal body complex protein FliE [Acidobacterium sp.]
MQSIAAIAQAVTGQDSHMLSSLSGVGGGASPAPFAGFLKGALTSMNALEQRASTATQGLLMGTGVDVSQAMIATQKADTAFEFALAVHSKAVSAYQQVMNLQF